MQNAKNGCTTPHQMHAPSDSDHYKACDQPAQQQTFLVPRRFHAKDATPRSSDAMPVRRFGVVCECDHTRTENKDERTNPASAKPEKKIGRSKYAISASESCEERINW